MKTKIKYLLAYIYDFILRLRDIRFSGQVIFVIIVLLISWSGVKAIEMNYGLQKQISTLQQENSVQDLENKDLALENEYYNSSQYLELQARQNVGLALPGEKDRLVPQSVAMAYAPSISLTDGQSEPKITPPLYQKDVQSWVNYFLHRQAF